MATYHSQFIDGETEVWDAEELPRRCEAGKEQSMQDWLVHWPQSSPPRLGTGATTSQQCDFGQVAWLNCPKGALPATASQRY